MESPLNAPHGPPRRPPRLVRRQRPRPALAGGAGGAAGGETDLADAVRTAVINKRAGGMGLILGRKAFKKSMADGVKLINAVQDVYLDGKVTIA